MATRPVFISINHPPFYRIENIDFKWSAGFAVSQLQKNIVEIHNKFCTTNTNKRVLEISSKSLQGVGRCLSAFELKKHVPSLGQNFPVECIYQGSKVFENGGPYTDLYLKSPKEAKSDERLKNSGNLIRYEFEGVIYSLSEMLSFYDLIYISALKENPDLANELLQYDAFTDICYNPNKSKNCQAKSAAIYKSLIQ